MGSGEILNEREMGVWGGVREGVAVVGYLYVRAGLGGGMV